MIDIPFSELTEEQLAKRKKFEELYQQQVRERDNLKDKKMQQNQRNKDPEELMLHIQKEFRRQYEEIKTKLDQKLIKTQTDVDESLVKFKELQDYYLNKSYALTSYDKQQYKETLEQLECSLYNIRSIIVPRKPFKFSKPFATQRLTTDKPEEVKIQFSIDQRIISPEQPYNGEIFDGGSLVIRNLKNEEVNLKGELDTMYLLSLEDTVINFQDVRGSVWVDKCQRCTIVGQMHQLRIHETYNTSFTTFVTSKPIIERSSQLLFAALKGVQSDKQNYWNDIQDFNWLKQDKSPNFQVLE